VYVPDGGAFTMTSGEIHSNGVFTMSGGKIHDNDNGVLFSGVSFTMSGGKIHNNKNGVNVDSKGQSKMFTMSGSEIYSNNNGVIVDKEEGESSAVFSMNNGKIYDNTESGVQIDNGSEFNMTGGEINGNSGDGGVVVKTNSTFNMEGGRVCNNESVDVYVQSGRFSMAVDSNSEIYGNTYGEEPDCDIMVKEDPSVSVAKEGGTIYGKIFLIDEDGVYTAADWQEPDLWYYPPRND
jgi:hypothetical protein